MQIRPTVQSLVAQMNVPAPSEAEQDDLISVSAATGRLAFVYERFRNTLEPDEEDILRRNAIHRILERRIDEDRPVRVIATALLQELIRAHYIAPVNKSYIGTVAQIIEKAKYINSNSTPEIAGWFMQLMAVAIDRELFPWMQEEALVQLMYHDAATRTVWTDQLVSETDRATQLYLACHRALFAADEYEISYHYFGHHFSNWRVASLSELEIVVNELPGFYQQLQKMLHHSAGDRLARLVYPATVPYRIMRDIMQDQPGALEDKEKLSVATREAINKRMRRLRDRMSRRAWHSILFLFMTKTVIAILVELPYETLFLDGGVQWLALGINIAFHPLLLFFLATSVRLPGQRNADKIVEQVRKIVSGDGELPTIVVSTSRSYGAATWSVFAVVYAILFMGIFWGLFSLLSYLRFSLLAMFLFVVFLGLVSFLAIRIRRSVNEIRLVTPREGALSAIISFLSLPILEFGRWLAQNIRQINFVLFIMDRVLEAPFKLLIDVAEEWFDFVRDRREEIV